MVDHAMCLHASVPGCCIRLTGIVLPRAIASLPSISWDADRSLNLPGAVVPGAETRLILDVACLVGLCCTDEAWHVVISEVTDGLHSLLRGITRTMTPCVWLCFGRSVRTLVCP